MNRYRANISIKGVDNSGQKSTWLKKYLISISFLQERKAAKRKLSEDKEYDENIRKERKEYKQAIKKKMKLENQREVI